MSKQFKIMRLVLTILPILVIAFGAIKIFLAQ